MAPDELVRLLANTFIARRDVKAIQSESGAYRPIHEKWTMQDLRDHIEGRRSLGHYTVNQDGLTKLFAFDIDLDSYALWGNAPICDRAECQKPHIPEHNIHPREVWRDGTVELCDIYRKQFRALGEGLASRITRCGVKAAIAYSGSKGVHVYGFTGEAPAEHVRLAAIKMLETHTYERVRGDNFWKHQHEFAHMTIEVFPKQETVRNGDGLGNLMRLPLGRNTKGGMAYFLDPTAPEGEFRALDPMTAMQTGVFEREPANG